MNVEEMRVEKKKRIRFRFRFGLDVFARGKLDTRFCAQAATESSRRQL
jgi:hypothetical protein